MSTRVSVRRRGGAKRFIGFGVALIVSGGASIGALLAVTSAATGSLMVAVQHRPNAIDGWRSSEPPHQVFARNEAPRPVALRQDRLEDAFRSADAAGQGAGLERLREELATSAPKSETTFVRASRVISPDEPVVLASVTPPSAPAQVASLEPVAPIVRPIVVEPAPTVAADEDPRSTPFPLSRPADFARMAQERAPSRLPTTPVRLEASEPKPVALAYAAPEVETKSDGPADFFGKLLGQGVAQMPGRGSGIAVYDIASATVRLPNGEKLEAHSGLGHRQDNAAYVREKNRGPTPPNVYNLRMREARFHGSEAIRLLPRDMKKVFNRDGLLAHPYMYAGGGPRSQSNGCVVFKDYGRFLRAFKAGEIAKLVVVPNMAELRTYMTGL